MAAVDDSFIEPTTHIPVRLGLRSRDELYNGLSALLNVTVLDNDEAELEVEGNMVRLGSQPRAAVTVRGAGMRHIVISPDSWFRWKAVEVVKVSKEKTVKIESEDPDYRFTRPSVGVMTSPISMEVYPYLGGTYHMKLIGEPFDDMRVRVVLDMANQFCFEDNGLVAQPRYWQPCTMDDACDCRNVGPLLANMSSIYFGHQNFSSPVYVGVGRVDTFEKAPARLAIRHRLYVEEVLVDAQWLMVDEPNPSERASVAFHRRQVFALEDMGNMVAKVGVSTEDQRLGVSLGTKPWDDVTITVGGHFLVFTASTWDQAQWVPVHVNDTLAVEFHSLDASYSGKQIVVHVFADDREVSESEGAFPFDEDTEGKTYNASMMVLQRTMMMSTYVSVIIFLLLILYRVFGPSKSGLALLGDNAAKGDTSVKEPLLRAKFAALFLRPPQSAEELSKGRSVVVRYVSEGRVEYHRGKVAKGAGKSSSQRRLLQVEFDDGDHDDSVEVGDVRAVY